MIDFHHLLASTSTFIILYNPLQRVLIDVTIIAPTKFSMISERVIISCFKFNDYRLP